MELRRVQKRTGEIVRFDHKKIRRAIEMAMLSSGEGNEVYAKKVTITVLELLDKKYDKTTPNIEDVQDAVEISLMKLSLFKTAKSYILYRNERARNRKNA